MIRSANQHEFPQELKHAKHIFWIEYVTGEKRNKAKNVEKEEKKS